MDSDGDGAFDKIAAELIRPGDTETGRKVASILHASPYNTVAAGSLRGGSVVDPIGDEPGHFTGWEKDYFVPRGYAMVEVDMQGTGQSEGCVAVGGEEDTRSVKAVVDWLNGRTTATYADGTPATASWSTGNVGMIGTSYDGTLPIGLAETGIAGLKTIVPVAAISSWYDYTRASGIGYSPWGNRWAEGFANRRSNARALQLCAAKYLQLGDSEADDTNDYTAHYVPRNFRDQASQIKASVFLVHGQQDWNVKTTQFGRYWDRLVANNIPRKLYLHDGEHVDPFWSDLDGRDQVGRWMDYWLNGIPNGVMDEPQATIVRPNGTKTTDAVWPDSRATNVNLTFGTGSFAFTDPSSQSEAEITDAPQTVKSNRFALLSPVLASEQRLSGIGRFELTFASDVTSTALNVLVVEYKDNVLQRIVTRGALDAKNRASLSAGTPLVVGQQYTATVELEPKDYIFPKGSQIGLLVTANSYQYTDVDPVAHQVTLSLAASRAVLPLYITPAPVCTDPAYVHGNVYNGGSIVSHLGKRWKAKWWTQNEVPGSTGQWGVWEDLGVC